MSGVTVRAATSGDYRAIANILESAFKGTEEVDLVDHLRQDDDVVLELVALVDGKTIVGHILFSRLKLAGPPDFDVVALAPLAVAPEHQGKGVGTRLVRAAHERLASSGEVLSVVLGEPEYYGRFGYEHLRAAGFECPYQGEYLQALAFADAPSSGTLTYAPAFGAL